MCPVTGIFSIGNVFKVSVQLMSHVLGNRSEGVILLGDIPGQVAGVYQLISSSAPVLKSMDPLSKGRNNQG